MRVPLLVVLPPLICGVIIIVVLLLMIVLDNPDDKICKYAWLELKTLNSASPLWEDDLAYFEEHCVLEPKAK